MSPTERLDEADIEASIERGRQPNHPEIGRVVLERTEVAQQEFDASTGDLDAAAS